MDSRYFPVMEKSATIDDLSIDEDATADDFSVEKESTAADILNVEEDVALTNGSRVARVKTFLVEKFRKIMKSARKIFVCGNAKDQ